MREVYLRNQVGLDLRSVFVQPSSPDSTTKTLRTVTIKPSIVTNSYDIKHRGDTPMAKTAKERMQAYRERKKVQASPEVVEAHRQCDRLKRLLTDHPALSSQFDSWMSRRNEEIKKRRKV
jgi:hypothetical protein